MNSTDFWGVIVNACGLGGALTGITVLATLPRTAPRRHIVALIALLAIFAVDMASSIFDLSSAAADYPGLVWISLLLWPWIPVCLWMYVDALIGGSRKSGSYRWHYGIAAVGTICILPYFMLSASARLELENGAMTWADPYLLLALAGLPIFFLLWIGSMLVIGVKTVRALAVHRQRMRGLLSNVSAVELRWIDGFMLFIGIGLMVSIVDNLMTVATGTDLLNTPASAAFEACIIVGLVMFGVHQQQVIPRWAEEPEIVGPAAENISEPRYARSSLTAEDCAAIVARLDAIMVRDELWRNPLLNLKTLSEKITTRPYYVTQALNTACERNFYDYVNSWRVRAAAKALLSDDASVLSICEDVGFNSKSTFNAVFRREMGVTPTAYRQKNMAPPAL